MIKETDQISRLLCTTPVSHVQEILREWIRIRQTLKPRIHKTRVSDISQTANSENRILRFLQILHQSILLLPSTVTSHLVVPSIFIFTEIRTVKSLFA